MYYFRIKFCGCVSAKLIRSEAPLNELDPGSFFFTLYVDDFIESSIKETVNGTSISKKTFRTLNDRYYLSTVKFIFFIAIYYFFINRNILRKIQQWVSI